MPVDWRSVAIKESDMTRLMLSELAKSESETQAQRQLSDDRGKIIVERDARLKSLAFELGDARLLQDSADDAIMALLTEFEKHNLPMPHLKLLIDLQHKQADQAEIKDSPDSEDSEKEDGEPITP